MSRSFFDAKAEATGSGSGSGLCVICKGTKNLCGKERCPLMLQFYSQKNAAPKIDVKDIEGSSPPAVFVGTYGYPKVDIGPLLPTEFGDTSMLDAPERWQGLSIDDISAMRFKLVRGKYRIDAKDFRKAGRVVDDVQELALTAKPTDVEANFDKKPTGRLILNDDVMPFGPSGSMQQMKVSNGRFDRYLERSFYDTDMKSSEAVINAYNNGTTITEIQKAFSVATMGIERNRRFVPTRWSITAVDDIIGKDLLKTTRYNDTIGEFRVYTHHALDNWWAVIMLPCSWRFEIVEAWHPRSSWNQTGESMVFEADSEFYDGRKGYATQVGGSYYAARMAVTETLNAENRSAGVVILREIRPGYIMPLGVWNIRENVRAALQTQPFVSESLEACFRYLDPIMTVKKKTLVEHSSVLRDFMTQRRIEDFFF